MAVCNYKNNSFQGWLCLKHKDSRIFSYRFSANTIQPDTGKRNSFISNLSQIDI